MGLINAAREKVLAANQETAKNPSGLRPPPVKKSKGKSKNAKLWNFLVKQTPRKGIRGDALGGPIGGRKDSITGTRGFEI
jgi:hypothetical protein